MPLPPPDAESPVVSIADWLYVRTGLVWASQREVEPEYLDAPYQARHGIRAWWMRKGGLTVTSRGASVEAGEGAWVFPGSADGWQRFQPGSVVLSLAFFAEWPSGQPLFADRGILLLPASGQQRRLERAATALVRSVERVVGHKGFYLLAEGKATVERYFAIRRAFEDWLSAYVAMMRVEGFQPSSGTEADPRTIRAARLLDDQPLHSALSESALAHAVGLSVSQLNRLFLRDWGISPRRYREQRQMEKAAALLQLHRHSVKEVASLLGFRSLSHFSAWFRRLKGESPRTFQKTHPA